MKKTVNGSKYDTETAKLLGSYEFAHQSDPNYVSETLYVRPTGEYFLHGCGGSRSRYSVLLDDNTRKGRELIIPMSEREAKKWADAHLTGSEYKKIFGKAVA